MPETVTVDGTPVAKGAATVSASALALHRTYISKLEAEGVIQRQGDGFPPDQEPRSLFATTAAREAAATARGG
jgi:hypothetical protein